jgi:hypothetical protein
VKFNKHYKASRSTKGKAWRWPCDVVFTATSSEEGHNICKTAMPASVPAIGFRCSRSLCPCLRKSLYVGKLGIDIYHIDMTMFRFPWYPRKRTNLAPRHPNIVHMQGIVSVASHVWRQPRSTSRHRMPQRGGGIFGLPVIHGGDPIPVHRAAAHPPSTLLNLSLLERCYFLQCPFPYARGFDNGACSRRSS